MYLEGQYGLVRSQDQNGFPLSYSYRNIVDKNYDAVAKRQKDEAQQRDVEGARAQELRLAPSAAVQEQRVPKNHEVCIASVQEDQKVSHTKSVTQDDLDEYEAEGEKGVEEAERNDMTEVTKRKSSKDKPSKTSYKIERKHLTSTSHWHISPQSSPGPRAKRSSMYFTT